MNPMNHFETGSFIKTSEARACPDAVRIVSWNINRGQLLKEVIEFLAGTGADLVLLQEADLCARRTHYRNVAREIAKALEMNYVFGYEFEELTQGQNGTPAYHGQATLSIALVAFAHPQVPSSVKLLASAMVHSARHALPATAWWKNGAYQLHRSP